MTECQVLEDMLEAKKSIAQARASNRTQLIFQRLKENNNGIHWYI